jgi:hypothetical protein
MYVRAINYHITGKFLTRQNLCRGQISHWHRRKILCLRGIDRQSLVSGGILGANIAAIISLETQKSRRRS